MCNHGQQARHLFLRSGLGISVQFCDSFAGLPAQSTCKRGCSTQCKPAKLQPLHYKCHRSCMGAYAK